MKILFLIVGIYALPIFESKATPNLREYKTDTIVLRTDLPSEFSEFFLEYANGFSSLIIDFWAESRKENFKMDIHLTIFRNCRDFSLFKEEKMLSGSSIYFSKLEQKSSSEFSMAGCYSNSRFFFRAFQNKFVELMMYDKKKKNPTWLKQGMVDYFENSLFIADDFSIIPIVKNEYLLRLKQVQYTNTGNGDSLKKLIISSKKQWEDNSKYYFPYTWAFFWYLMDVHPKGRNILTKYIQNIKYTENEIDLNKSFDATFGFMGSSNQISIKELEREFHFWLNSLDEPRGYSKFKELSNYNVTSSRLKILFSALELNRNFALYYDSISEEYFLGGDLRNALDFAESALERDIRNKSAIKRAIQSSFRLGEYSKADYYLWLAAQIRLNIEEFKDIQKKIITYKRENQDSLSFQPEVKFLNFE